MSTKFDPILITGAAGFIGYHLGERLLADGRRVVGLDCVDHYYDPKLKEARIARLSKHSGFELHRFSVEDSANHMALIERIRPQAYVHLAAQAGVRYSMENPAAYVDSNIVGFGITLEACRQFGVEHLVYASSSSVYGANAKVPSSVEDNVDHPVSLYAATKKANELMAHTYSHLYGLPTTGLRFFTVYGPWGRPDMALFLFVNAILEGRPIDVFNYGDMKRDFTYVDDIVEGIVRVIDKIPAPISDPAISSNAPYKVYNIGSSIPVQLLRMIEVVEESLGMQAEKNLMPFQLGDVYESLADVSGLAADVGFRPATPIEVGIPRFVEWYREYYNCPK